MTEKKKVGGARPGAGRKPKAEEERIKNLSLASIVKAFGSEAEGWDHLAKQAIESLPHMKMLWEYTYGKPKETVDLPNGGIVIRVKRD